MSPRTIFCSFVGRLVIHDENLADLGLASQRIDARSDGCLFITRGNDGADEGRTAGGGSGRCVRHVLVAIEGCFRLEPMG